MAASSTAIARTLWRTRVAIGAGIVVGSTVGESSVEFGVRSRFSRSDPMIVLVTETEFRRAEDAFQSADGVRCIAVPGDEPALARAILDLGARYVVVGSVRYLSELYGALPRGGVIARFGVGHDSIDKEKA